MLVLKIAGAVLALLAGVWLGLPGRYDQPIDEIEQIVERGGGRPRKVKRRFTPLAWIQRKIESSPGGARRRRAFKLERPEDR